MYILSIYAIHFSLNCWCSDHQFWKFKCHSPMLQQFELRSNFILMFTSRCLPMGQMSTESNWLFNNVKVNCVEKKQLQFSMFVVCMIIMYYTLWKCSRAFKKNTHFQCFICFVLLFPPFWPEQRENLRAFSKTISDQLKCFWTTFLRCLWFPPSTLFFCLSVNFVYLTRAHHKSWQIHRFIRSLHITSSINQ